MKLTASFLSPAEQEHIHKQSLKILGEVGVRIHGQRALPLLAAHGATVDADTRIARIPEELVAQALAAAPKSFTLGARNPAFDYGLPSPATHFCMDGTAAFARDYASGERRYGVKKDTENAARIFQKLPLGVMAWPPVTASDAPAGSRPLHEFFTMLQFTAKHGQHELHTPAQVPYLIAGLQAILGSEDAIRARNCASVIYCPVAPLTHDGPMLDAYLELGQWDMPVMIMPMPVPGSTGPASLFGNISVANAECLSSIVIFQLAHPGRPLIYSSAVGSLDFTSGGFLGGTPEMGLQSAALVQMGRFYGLPSTAAGCTADAKEPGAQAVIEKLITTLPPLLAGADIVVGFGEVEGDQLLVLEQYLIDHEIARLCERLAQGIDCSEEKHLFADIAQVGPGGHFLKAKSTRLAPRSGEFLLPILFDRHTYESWVELGRPTMLDAARQKVDAILAAPVEDPLPDSALGALDEILRQADEAMGEG